MVSRFPAELRRQGFDVRDDGTLAAYSSDASLYRVPPLAVVRPRDAAEVAAALAACRDHGVPVTARGGGTSVAGNAIGPGVLLDFSRHMNRVLSVDADARVATVQPGVVQAMLQRAVAPHRLRFGPDPSTSSRCTVGGMIGNDACGARSLGYGRTSDNLAGLTLLTAGGDVVRTGYDQAGRPVADGLPEAMAVELHAAVAAHLAAARTEFGRFPRQVSGYAVQWLLPERFDLTRALAGSEGTLALLTEATVRLVSEPAHRLLVVIGFDDIVAAGHAAPAVVACQPSACEGLDKRLIEVLVSRRGPDAVPPLPRGGAWLFTELSGDDADAVRERAASLAAAGLGTECRVVTDPAEAARLWRIREDGAGLAGRAPSGKPAWPGWEDAAVPPARLGDYLELFDALVASHGLTSAPYGHFGEGCMHVRLDFPLGAGDGATRVKRFLQEAAVLVAGFGGSLSGEHGDGRARGELLPLMYSEQAIAMFEGIKHAFDPRNLLNPGVLVDPAPVDAAIRIGPWLRDRSRPGFAYTDDDGDFARALHRCTGVGKCRADNSGSGGVMCPSYLATGEELDSTRGRARVLQEAITGSRLTWRSPEVHDALDLCLSCKACALDCPTGIDMATYKSEVLHRGYRRRLRPRSHYALGQLPRWIRFATPLPSVANLLVSLPGLRRVMLAVAGVDRRRSLPRFASTPFRRWWSRRGEPAGDGQPVLVFVDSFSNAFSPAAAQATVELLEAAGYQPRITGPRVCCALTWITTGQLDAARRILRRSVAELAPAARAGIPIVGIEPSCTAVLRKDAVELLDDQDTRAVAAATVTLAELLSRDPGWSPPDLAGVTVIAQPHCHHYAVLGWQADEALLRRTGADLRRLAGCCGLAGNFGVESGHYDVSVAVAAQHLLPAVDAAPDAIVVADGFSCRTQLADLRDRPARHLAELLTHPPAHRAPTPPP